MYIYAIIPELFFHHNDDQSCSFLLQYTKYIATITKTNRIVQKAVVHTTADILLPPQSCPSSSAITVLVVVVVKTNKRNIKCVKSSRFHRGRGHHIIRFSHRLCGQNCQKIKIDYLKHTYNKNDNNIMFASNQYV